MTNLSATNICSFYFQQKEKGKIKSFAVLISLLLLASHSPSGGTRVEGVTFRSQAESPNVAFFLCMIN